MSVMIAAFLRTDDGDFDVGGLAFAVFLVFLFCIAVWTLRHSLVTGRLMYSPPDENGPSLWVARAARPVGFWVAFVVWALFAVFLAYCIFAVCTGAFREAAPP
jgi:hypothetical protein